MSTYERETFSTVRFRSERAAAQPLTFLNCKFIGCSYGVLSTDQKHIAAPRVKLYDCEVRGGGLLGVIVEDVLVENLTVRSFPRVLGCLFRHVTLRGKINKLIIDSRLPVVVDPAPFDRAAREYYEAVDWAIDISAIDSSEFEIRGLPSRLIRRDPSTQAVVRRDEACRRDWRSLDLLGSGFGIALHQLEMSDWEDVILVAARTGARAGKMQEALDELRSAGIAVQD